jgi:hypothetical protein
LRTLLHTGTIQFILINHAQYKHTYRPKPPLTFTIGANVTHICFHYNSSGANLMTPALHFIYCIHSTFSPASLQRRPAQSPQQLLIAVCYETWIFLLYPQSMALLPPNSKITQELPHCRKQATANVPPWHAEKVRYRT